MLRQYLPGSTYTLLFNFFATGVRTFVDDPVVDIFTPERTKHLEGQTLTLVSGVTGRYRFDFFVNSGLTVGSWFGLASGITDSARLFADQVPFEIIDPVSEPFWLSLEDLREHLQIEDDCHDQDDLHKSMLQAAMEVTESYTKRKFGLRTFSETHEVKSTTRVRLDRYPVQTIVALTATAKIIPRTVDQLVTETVTNERVNFFFRLDAKDGIVLLVDSAGFDEVYDGLLLAITYKAGFNTIPENVRRGALMIASRLINLATNEGMRSISVADLSFSMSDKVLDQAIRDMLNPFRDTGI